MPEISGAPYYNALHEDIWHNSYVIKQASSCRKTQKKNCCFKQNDCWTSWNIRKKLTYHYFFFLFLIRTKNWPGSKGDPEKWQLIFPVMHTMSLLLFWWVVKDTLPHFFREFLRLKAAGYTDVQGTSMKHWCMQRKVVRVPAALWSQSCGNPRLDNS